MRIDDTTEAFWLLYLINIFQPVGQDQLEEQTRRLQGSARKAASEAQISKTLADLVRANMAILRPDGLYAVTLLGLQKLSVFRLGFSRDKNRMFELKNRFRT
jgi:hypothetical protein